MVFEFLRLVDQESLRLNELQLVVFGSQLVASGSQLVASGSYFVV